MLTLKLNEKIVIKELAEALARGGFAISCGLELFKEREVFKPGDRVKVINHKKHEGKYASVLSAFTGKEYFHAGKYMKIDRQHGQLWLCVVDGVTNIVPLQEESMERINNYIPDSVKEIIKNA